MSQMHTPTPPSNIAVSYPTNNLKQKLGNGGFEYQRLLKAEQRLRATRQDFPSMAQRELHRINSALYNLKDESLSASEKDTLLRNIFVASVDLKSNSSMFTYEVTEKIAESLQFFTEHLGAYHPDALSVVDIHYQALLHVFERGHDFIIEPQREEIMKKLQSAVLAYREQHKKN
jgi:hypothetical protein